MLNNTEMDYVALPTALVKQIRAGDTDANNQLPQRLISDGNGNPCRHCLTNIEAGAEMLLLAHRPFPVVHAYAELGPVFLCADECERYDALSGRPPMLENTQAVIARGYDDHHRIVGGTGQVVTMDKLDATMVQIMRQSEVSYLHLRSTSNNCFFCRVEHRAVA